LEHPHGDAEQDEVDHERQREPEHAERRDREHLRQHPEEAGREHREHQAGQRWRPLLLEDHLLVAASREPEHAREHHEPDGELDQDRGHRPEDDM
jgi:hypothetical protein